MTRLLIDTANQTPHLCDCGCGKMFIQQSPKQIYATLGCQQRGKLAKEKMRKLNKKTRESAYGISI